MEQNVSLIVKNNLIALAFHICMCLIFICLILGILPLINATMGMSLLIALPCGIIALYLYFWVGKRFLSNTKTTVTDYFSVGGFFVLILALTILYGGLPIFSLWSVFWIVCESFQIVYEPIELMLNNIAMTTMPPFMMWLGLLAKRRKAGLNESESNENEPQGDEQFPNE